MAGAAVAVPAVAATTQPQPTASLLSDEGEREVREALDRTRAASRARAARAPADPRTFAGLSDARALRAATDAHPGLFAARPTRLLAPRPDERIERYLGDYGARLDVPGPADAIVSSDLPLRVDVDGDKRPVDLVLVDRGDRLAPATPLVESSFPDALGDGLTVGDDISVRLVGGDPSAVAKQTGQQVFYANALPDADLLATPLPLGLETFVQLRSPDSPRELAFEFGLPAGARLEAQMDGVRPTGGVSIVRGDREIGWSGHRRPTTPRVPPFR